MKIVDCTNCLNIVNAYNYTYSLMQFCFCVGLVPEQKSEIPEAGEAIAEGFDTNSRLPRCHDEEYLSWC